VNKKQKEIVEKALKLIQQPGAWTQGYMAVDKDGRGVGARASNARSWCLIGAINVVATEGSDEWDFCCNALRARLGVSLSILNDDAKTVGDVVAFVESRLK
jgi:hypothetical protein